MSTQKLLEKISWKTRKWNLKFHLFNLYLHDHDGSWGFNLLAFNYNFQFYSLLSFEFRLPDKTTVRKFTVNDWDFLWLYNPLWEIYDDLSESKLWGAKLSCWDKFRLSILDNIFK